MQKTQDLSQTGDAFKLDASLEDSTSEEAAGRTVAGKLNPVEETIKEITESAITDLEKFETLNRFVEVGLKMFVRTGLALDEINRFELWKEGGHANWNAYCKTVCACSRSHANRIILSAKIATYLAKQTPDRFTKKDMEPRNEYQMRPLAFLQSKEQWVEAWCHAVTKANGQPTHEIVESIVNEMIGSSGPKRIKQPSLKEIVQEVIARIRILMDEGRPNEIERLLVELDEAVNTKKKVDSQ